MKLIEPRTLPGFRDFLPADALARNFVIAKMKKVFEQFGYDPLETPAMEYAETLLGKYGNEADKLLYSFKDRGQREVGLRYDQTVPLARVVASYPTLPKPFKRYQIQPVWRAEKPQSGRYREFLQCDIDIVGTASSLADAEIISCAIDVCQELGFKDVQMRINDRAVFDQIGLTPETIIILDKMEKIGKDGVRKELAAKKVKGVDKIFSAIDGSLKTARLEEIFSALISSGLREGQDFIFDPYLARGLEYYTSTVFELKANYKAGSLAGGGRYDNLIGSFTGTATPATGLAFGFDRIFEAMRQNNLLPETKTATYALVTVFSPKLLKLSARIAAFLRDAGVNTELYLDTTTKLDRQLKYADKKGIPFAIIIGPEEADKNLVTIKNLATKSQKTIPEDRLLNELK